MSIGLVQVVKRQGEIDKVARDDIPIVELHLEDNQRIVSMDLRPKLYDRADRKTVDWKWTAYVETRL